MSINTNKTVPFTDVASDFMKAIKISDNIKSSYVDFTATDFASLRASLIEYIRAIYPVDYNNFIESDLGIMLVELVSYMGAIMSMKADMLAHENFIHTAKDRESVRKLFKLVGLSLKGPTSAQAVAKLTMPDDSSTVLDKAIELDAENRVVVVTSPEDGEPVTYTIYKAIDGVVSPLDDYNADLEITAANYTPGVENSWDVVLLEGAFATESGTFSQLDTFKSISLEESPVIQNSVQVFLESSDIATSGAFRQVEDLYQASSSSDKMFQVIYDDQFKAKIIFGNGTNGVSPTNNSDYIVTYRVGGGDRGNVPDGYINSLIAGTYNAADASFRLEQAQIATGGADAETIDHAKKYGPLAFKRQDRIVSLDDYATFASRFVSPAGTTGKATVVARKAYSSANIIDLYILEKASSLQLQKASISFKNALLTAISEKKLITDDVVISDGLIRTLDLLVTVSLDRRFQGVESTLVTKISNVIKDYFLSDNMDFGDSISFASLNRVIFGIEEVKFSTIDNFEEEIISVDFNEIIQLNNTVINVNYV